MINITVVAYNGASTAALVGHFDELGGNIGRAENNQLVLPDPERTISRVHAQVVFRNGRYAIVDRGSNPISVNGRPLGNGQEALIQPGDEVQIGGYTMRVEAAAPAGAAAADPFADFAGLAATSPPAAPARPAAAPYADPLAGFGGAPARPPVSGGVPAAPSASVIPADWDPFAPDPVAAAPANDLSRSLGTTGGSHFGLEVGGRAEPLIPDFAPGAGGRGDSLDALFGLGGGGGGGGDPLAGSALSQAASQPNMAAHADPLKSLNSITRGSATAAPDTTSELSSPFQVPPMVPQPGRAAPPAGPRPGPPQAPPMRPPAPQAMPHAMPPAQPRPGERPAPFIPPTSFHSGFAGADTPPPPSAAAARPQPPVASVPPSEQTAPPGSVLSWDDPSGESRTVIRPRGAASAEPVDLSLDFAATAPPSALPGPGTMAPPAAQLRPPGAPAGAMPSAQTYAPAPPPPAMPHPAQMQQPQRPGPPFGQPPGQTMHGSTPTHATAATGHALSPARPAPSPPMRPSTPAGTPAWRPPPGVAQPTAAQPSGHAPGAHAEIAALTAALREGLGTPSLPPDSLVLTPTFMRLLGRLIHEATRGTVDLLVARAALKREIRAEVTMIVTRENNPLKFSPSAEVALGHLLSPPARGFMEGDRAMRDAYEDLRAHQFGFLAGMRAALEGILNRFDPAVLEAKLTQKSMLSSLLPAKRKAKMWDVFTELYGQISSEASDDFHELFGKEFLRAYNEYIDQLSRDRP